jgi:hypothetical protein
MKQWQWIFTLFIFLGGICAQSHAQFDGATIDDRQRAYIEDDGRYWTQHPDWEPGCWRQCIFAWLENNNHQNDDKIIEEINLLLSNGDPNDNWQNGWMVQSRPAQVTLLRILLDYSHVLGEIAPDLINKIKSHYHRSIEQGELFHANPNGKARGHAAMYLYAEHVEPDIEVIYPYNWDENDIFPQFSYDGRKYINGGKYRALELSRDWIQYTFDFWVSERARNQEFASVNYTKIFIDALALLYDFSQDQTIKRKAKMMLDFLLLESVLNYSANHWGGPHKRMYLQTYWDGYDAFYWQFFWGLHRSTNDKMPVADVYVTTYRPSPVIQDIGNLSDESDNYFHINRFSNLAFNIADKGSYCFVTKNYNLGTGFNWQLNILSEDGSGAYKGKPFMLWINNKPYSNPNDPFSPPPENSEYYDGGDDGYQYRNAMFVIPGGKPYLHISVGNNSFDEITMEDDWQFYREGKVAVAIKIHSTNAALEVATIGVDYGSFGEFKSVIKTNARLELDRFTSSKAFIITSNTVDGQYPFKRLECEDNQGNEIVQWENQVMTVRKHGMIVVYNFNNWQYDEDPSSWDTIPPDPPQGVDVSNGKK